MRPLLALALLIGCASPPRPAPTRVKLIRVGDRQCSAVQVGPCKALTAAHCFYPGDTRVALVQVGDSVEAEGWGCEAARARSMLRRAKVTAVNRMLIGYEIELSIPLCHGDSGGALWDERGRLVGVLTGTSATRGYATPVSENGAAIPCAEP